MEKKEYLLALLGELIKDVWQRQISLLQIEMTRETKKIKERIKYWQDLIDEVDNKQIKKTVVYMPDIKIEEEE